MAAAASVGLSRPGGVCSTASEMHARSWSRRSVLCHRGAHISRAEASHACSQIGLETPNGGLTTLLSIAIFGSTLAASVKTLQRIQSGNMTPLEAKRYGGFLGFMVPVSCPYLASPPHDLFNLSSCVV